MDFFLILFVCVCDWLCFGSIRPNVSFRSPCPSSLSQERKREDERKAEEKVGEREREAERGREREKASSTDSLLFNVLVVGQGGICGLEWLRWMDIRTALIPHPSPALTLRRGQAVANRGGLLNLEGNRAC